MSRTLIFTQNLIDCRDKSLVGGKAANLGRLGADGVCRCRMVLW